jgi:hypothetical protein
MERPLCNLDFELMPGVAIAQLTAEILARPHVLVGMVENVAGVRSPVRRGPRNGYRCQTVTRSDPNFSGIP